MPKTYTGVCIGGPLDRKMITKDKDWFQVSEPAGPGKFEVSSYHMASFPLPAFIHSDLKPDEAYGRAAQAYADAEPDETRIKEAMGAVARKWLEVGADSFFGGPLPDFLANAMAKAALGIK